MRFTRSLGLETKPEKVSETHQEIDFLWGAKIPTPDGIHLNATIYKPKGSEPTPAIFTLTPYIADSYHDRAMYFARNGFAFILVDCRGRGHSEGRFDPFFNEGQDGCAVVEWLASQPWCNRSVGMWGGSYGGFNQWMTLKEFPAALKTIVPAAAAHPGVDYPFFNNIFFSYEIQWQTLVSGVTGNNNIFGEASFWIEKFRQLYLEKRPFQELDELVGNPTPNFQDLIQHPIPDQHWDLLALTPKEYDRIDIPILTITGHYDGDQPGALHYYRMHMQSASPARDRHYLIIGPWDHAGTRTPNKEFGGLTFGDACLVDLNQLHKDWYNWTIKGGPQPDFLKKRVAYYVMGAEEWKYADSLEEVSNATLKLYLNSRDGQANDVFHSGTLEDEPPEIAQPDTYFYDPLDLRPAELEKEEVKNSLIDQRYDLNLFGNGLVYHSDPFVEEIEITGWVKLRAWISLNVPDTDFTASLSEILLDGKRILLDQDWLRARYRESLRQEKLVNPGQIDLYEFTGFTFFSRRIAKGSRLRLVIACPNSIHIQKNYNGGGVVAAEDGDDARTAHVSLYHDADHPSCLELPVVIQSANS